MLLILAWRGFRGRPGPGEEAPLPKWMAALDRFTPRRSLSIGALFGGVKPKNLILAAAAAAGIAGAGLGGAQQVVVLLLLILVASIAIIAPVRGLLLPRRRALGARPRRLEDVGSQANNSAVISAIVLSSSSAWCCSARVSAGSDSGRRVRRSVPA